MNRSLLVLLVLLLGLGLSTAPLRAQDTLSAEEQAELDEATDSAVTAMDEEEEAEAVYPESFQPGTWKPYAEWRHVSDDTLAVRANAFDSARVALLAQDPELDYDRTNTVQMLWWDRFLRWLEHKLDRLFGSRGGRMVFRNLHWIILGIVAVFLLYYFRKHIFSRVFSGTVQRARQVREVEEDIERLDLDKLLRQAESARNWRLAVRYQYLKVLRRLVDERRITWEPRYTDQDYLAQLKDPATRATFSELSFLFKWVWYGDAPVDERRYHHVRPVFEAFHQRPQAA